MESWQGIEKFLEYAVTHLTEYPDAVSVRRREVNGAHVFDLHVDALDVPRIIGRSGGTIAALRGLAQAAATRNGLKVAVEVIG